MRFVFRTAVLLGAVTILVCGSAFGAVVSTVAANDLLPPNGSYQTPSAVHACYAAGGGTACFDNGNHAGFTLPSATYGAVEVEHFNSTFTGNLTVNGGAAGTFSLSGPVTIDIFGRSNGWQAGTFNTQMVQLDLSGTTQLGPVEVRIDPNTPSTGQTMITKNADGNSFHITSFFDIFTDISLDNGATWQPTNTGAALVQLNNGTGIDELAPEPTSMVLIGAGLLLVGYRARKQRKA